MLAPKNGAEAVPIQVQVASEEILHTCRFGFLKMQSADGLERFFVTFDIPQGPGLIRRVSVPFDGVAFGRFEDQLRAFRAGIEMP